MKQTKAEYLEENIYIFFITFPGVNLLLHFPKDKSSFKMLLSKVQVYCRHSVHLLIAGNIAGIVIHMLAADDMQFSFTLISPSPTFHHEAFNSVIMSQMHSILCDIRPKWADVPKQISLL